MRVRLPPPRSPGWNLKSPSRDRGTLPAFFIVIEAFGVPLGLARDLLQRGAPQAIVGTGLAAFDDAQ